MKIILVQLYRLNYLKPFEAIGALGKYDVIASVTGGGKSESARVVHELLLVLYRH